MYTRGGLDYREMQSLSPASIKIMQQSSLYFSLSFLIPSWISHWIILCPWQLCWVQVKCYQMEATDYWKGLSPPISRESWGFILNRNLPRTNEIFAFGYAFHTMKTNKKVSLLNKWITMNATLNTTFKF